MLLKEKGSVSESWEGITHNFFLLLVFVIAWPPTAFIAAELGDENCLIQWKVGMTDQRSVESLLI